MAEKKAFKLSTILSMTTGRLYCDMDDLYELTSHMVGEDVDTIQLSDLKDVVTQSVLEQLPWVKDIQPLALKREMSKEEKVSAIREWLKGLENQYGAYHEIAKLQGVEVKPSAEAFNSLSAKIHKHKKPPPRTVDRVRKLNKKALLGPSR